MAAGLLTSLAMTFGPGLLNWYLNRDLNETQEAALNAQEMLAAMQGQLMQNRARVEEPFRAGLLESLGGLIDRPQTALAPGRMSVVNPYLNLNRAKRSPTGEYSFEQALPGAKRQFIGPESFEQVEAPDLGFQEGVLSALAGQEGLTQREIEDRERQIWDRRVESRVRSTPGGLDDRSPGNAPGGLTPKGETPPDVVDPETGEVIDPGSDHVGDKATPPKKGRGR